MSDIVNFNKNLILHVNNPKDHDMICKVSRALASPERVRILKSLLNHPKYLSDLSKELDIPVSSVSRHIDVLAEAQLVFIDYQPGLKGHTKFCTQLATEYTISLYAPNLETEQEKEYTVEMPVGMFSHCHIKPPCGMAGKSSDFPSLSTIREYSFPLSGFRQNVFGSIRDLSAILFPLSLFLIMSAVKFLSVLKSVQKLSSITIIGPAILPFILMI